MAFNLTQTASNLAKEINKRPQLAIQIEGLGDIVFGTQPVLSFINWDQNTITWDLSGATWDGLYEDEFSKSYISFEGTTTNIGQQILPDKGGSSSVSTMSTSFIDKNGEVSRLLSLENIGDPLGKKCNVYIGFQQSAFPQDYIPVFRGVLIDFYNEPGMVNITCAHPSTLQRQSSFTKYTSQLNGVIDNSQTSITVLDTSKLIIPQDAVTTYIRIDDEAMLVNSIPNATTLIVTRAQFGTFAASHNDESDVESIYYLTGRPLDVALKLMLSNDNNEYFESLDIPKSINFISLSQSLPNALIFEYYDIQERTGLVSGDSILLAGGSNAGTYTVSSFGTFEEGSYIIVDETLVDDTEYLGTFSYRSKYNVLPNGAGLGMLTNEVDVAGHEQINSFFPSSFVDYSFPILDSIEDTKEFIEKEVYTPQGLYAIPRKARASVKYSVAPFSSDIVPTLNTRTIINITKIKQRRSAHKYLYNSFVWKYDRDPIDDKFLTNDVFISGDSINRIKLGRKPLTIESLGLTNSPATSLMLDQVSRRLDGRYRFAPTYLSGIEIGFGTGINLEVGDIIPFGGNDTRFKNITTGTSAFPEQLYEIINKKLNIKDGRITLDLLNSGFEINARYATISMSSIVVAGSTADRVLIERSYFTGDFPTESNKWLELIGETLRVRSPDYTRDSSSTFLGVDPANINALVFDPPLSFVPQVGDIVEPDLYQEASILDNERQKIRFGFWDYQGEIDTVVDESTFDVLDATQLVAGSLIYVHSQDYTRDSFDNLIEIDTIIGNTVTLLEPLPFLPQAGDKVERTNFRDIGSPYILL